MGFGATPHKTAFYFCKAFSFDTKGAKDKALQKENAVLWGVAPNPIRFLKKTKQKTFKLGHSAIKFEASTPDKIKSKTLNREQISIERTIFENSPKPFLLESFWRYLFSKR